MLQRRTPRVLDKPLLSRRARRRLRRWRWNLFRRLRGFRGFRGRRGLVEQLAQALVALRVAAPELRDVEGQHRELPGSVHERQLAIPALERAVLENGSGGGVA